MRIENYTDAYSPKEIKDKEKFLLWVKVKRRLIYILKVLIIHMICPFILKLRFLL